MLWRWNFRIHLSDSKIDFPDIGPQNTGLQHVAKSIIRVGQIDLESCLSLETYSTPERGMQFRCDKNG